MTNLLFALHDWPQHQLADLLENSEYGLSDRTVANGELPIVGMRAITDGRIDLNGLPTIRGTGVDIERYRLRKGDVLFNRTNSPDLVGKTGIVDENPDTDVVFASYLVRLRPRLACVVPEYLNLFLNSPVGQKRIRGLATKGVSQANVNPSTLAKFLTVPLPPLVEQQRIVLAVNMWSTTVRTLDKLISAKETLKSGLVQRLVTGKSRSSRFAHRVWRSHRLSDFFEHYVEENGDDPRIVLSCSKIWGIIPQSDKFARRLAPENLHRYKVVRDGDLVVDRMLLWDGSLAFVEDIPDGVVSPDYATFRFREEAGDRDFFRELLKSHLLRHVYKTIARGSNTRRRRVLPKDFLSIRLPIPERDEQAALGSLFAALNHEIRLVKRQRGRFQEQRRAIMHKLLNGDPQLGIDT